MPAFERPGRSSHLDRLADQWERHRVAGVKEIPKRSQADKSEPRCRSRPKVIAERQAKTIVLEDYPGALGRREAPEQACQSLRGGKRRLSATAL